MTPVAKDVADLLKELDQKEIALGPIVDPAGAGAGPGIQKGLADELSRLGIEVKNSATLRTHCQYALVTDTSSKLLAARITISVQDPSGKGLGSFKRDVKFRPGPEVKEADSAAVLGTLLAVTAALPPDAGLRDRQAVFLQSVESPKFHAAGSRISPNAESPYSIETLVADRARLPADHKGHAFIQLNKDEVYAVRLINNSDMDAAVTLTIDGLSMFAFSDRPELSQVIVPAKSAGIVRGWFRSNTKTEAFQVKAYPQTAAAEKLADASSLGTITAAFAAAWPKDKAIPRDEAFAQLASTRGEPLGTGRGPELNESFIEVERHIGVVRAVVTVRYSKEK